MISARSVAVDGFGYGARHVALRGLVTVGVAATASTRFFVSLSALTASAPALSLIYTTSTGLARGTFYTFSHYCQALDGETSPETNTTGSFVNQCVYSGIDRATSYKSRVEPNFSHVGLEQASVFDVALVAEHSPTNLQLETSLEGKALEP